MAKITLDSISAGYADIDLLNANFSAIATAIENTLSRDGTSPNTMSANLDMNSNRIINLAAPSSASDIATKTYVDSLIAAIASSNTPTPQKFNGGSQTYTLGTAVDSSDILVFLDGAVQIAEDAYTIVGGTTLTFHTTTPSGTNNIVVVYLTDNNFSTVTPDGSVDTDKLAADAVTGAKIADDSIDSEHYVDGSIDTAHIADDAVTYAKVQNVSATDKLLGRSTAGAGVIEEITCTSFARTILDDTDAATARATLGLSTIGSSIQQIVETSDSTHTSTAVAIPIDNSIPQNTEGAEFTQVQNIFTPTNASSTLLVEYEAYVTNSATAECVIGLFVDSGANAVSAVQGRSITSTTGIYLRGSYKVAAGSTSPKTFRLRYGAASGTTYINGGNSGRLLGGVMPAKIRITEIL